MNAWICVLFALAAVSVAALAFPAMFWYEAWRGAPRRGWWLGLRVYALDGHATAALAWAPALLLHFV